MVFKKRLDHGYNGFRVPIIPRAPRSVRVSICCNSQLWCFPSFYVLNSSSNSVNLCCWFQRWGVGKKKVEDSQIYAIELLASIAGKLLQESESSTSSNASEGNDQPATSKDVFKQEQQNEDKPFKEGWVYRGSCGDSSFASEVASPNISRKCTLREFSRANNDDVLERTSIVNKSDCSQKVSGDVKPIISQSQTDFRKNSTEGEGGSPHFGESYDTSVKYGIERQQEVAGLKTEGANICSSKDSIELSPKSPAATNSNSNVELPMHQDPVPVAGISSHRNDIKLGSRDDDEIFSRCFKPRTKVKACKPLPCIGDQRIRKLLTSKYWKAGPKLKDYELSRSGKQPMNGLTVVCRYLSYACVSSRFGHYYYSY